MQCHVSLCDPQLQKFAVVKSVIENQSRTNRTVRNGTNVGACLIVRLILVGRAGMTALFACAVLVIFLRFHVYFRFSFLRSFLSFFLYQSLETIIEAS